MLKKCVEKCFEVHIFLCDYVDFLNIIKSQNSGPALVISRQPAKPSYCRNKPPKWTHQKHWKTGSCVKLCKAGPWLYIKCKIDEEDTNPKFQQQGKQKSAQHMGLNGWYINTLSTRVSKRVQHHIATGNPSAVVLCICSVFFPACCSVCLCSEGLQHMLTRMFSNILSICMHFPKLQCAQLSQPLYATQAFEMLLHHVFLCYFIIYKANLCNYIVILLKGSKEEFIYFLTSQFPQGWLAFVSKWIHLLCQCLESLKSNVIKL